MGREIEFRGGSFYRKKSLGDTIHERHLVDEIDNSFSLMSEKKLPCLTELFTGNRFAEK
jgi:hypothetical protein